MFARSFLEMGRKVPVGEHARNEKESHPHLHAILDEKPRNIPKHNISSKASAMKNSLKKSSPYLPVSVL